MTRFEGCASLIPDGEAFDQRFYRFPYDGMYYAFWLRHQGRIEYRWRGRRIPVHWLSWHWRAGKATGRILDIEEFLLDGRRRFRGESGLTEIFELAKPKAGGLAVLQLFENELDAPSEVTESRYTFAEEILPTKWKSAARANGVRFESHENM